jgi:hypothetical protein
MTSKNNQIEQAISGTLAKVSNDRLHGRLGTPQ